MTDQNLGQSNEVTREHLEIKTDAQGDKVRIVGHSVSVKDIAVWHIFTGHSVEETATHYDLTLSDVYAALAYYYDHKHEIDQQIDVKDLRETLRKQREPKRSRISNIERLETRMLQRKASDYFSISDSFLAGWVIAFMIFRLVAQTELDEDQVFFAGLLILSLPAVYKLYKILKQNQRLRETIKKTNQNSDS
ncbi:MAG: DUF433 domain-containing protein [Chloroflexota bacterium]|nr:DUF433 domain-containing protein [Chloroflexota bacterium]